LEALVVIQGLYLKNTIFPHSKNILIPDAIKDDRSIYALLNFTEPRWILQGGLRFDYRKVTADASGEHFINKDFVLPDNPENRQLVRQFKGFTASSGVTFKPDEKWRLRLNLASGFRAPDMAERYFQCPHTGKSLFEAGNVRFDWEQYIQGDMGERFRNEDFTVS